MSSDRQVEALKALGHPLRLTIVKALGAGELNVGEIEERTDIGQPALSQQLAVLRKAGLVATRKDAKLVFYRLASDRLAELQALFASLAGENGKPDRPAEKAARPPAHGVANFARITR